jgi:DNA mismatch repair protein MutS
MYEASNMIYDDYIQYCDQYRELYGEKTVVLIQVGDFFELYGIQNDTETCGADMYTIGDICNLTVTRKNKSILENSRANPLMAGFPLHAVSKHTQTLLDNGYTIVLVRQVTPPPNVRREVTEILSPSTTMTPAKPDNNFLIVCHWEKYPNGTYSLGVAGADISTGYTFAYENATAPFDEVVRIVQTYAPREIVFSGATDVQINIAQNIHRITKPMKPSYIAEVLRKVYGQQGMLDPIEEIGLDRYDAARTAFVALILFLYEHNELIIARLQRPDILETRDFLTLEYNSAVQLNVIGCLPGDKPLISLLNKCSTAIGSREFKRRLLTPLADPSAIQTRYDRIDHIINSRAVLQIRKALKNVGDIERMLRRMELGTLSPIDWFAFHTSLEYVKTAAEYDDSLIANHINNIQRSYINILSIEECSKYTLADIKGSVFHHGIFPDVDALAESVAQSFARLDDIANNINGRIDSNERDGYFLQVTKKRWETAVLNGLDAKKYVTRPISTGSSVLRVQNTEIEKCSETILNGQRRIGLLVTTRYKEFMERFVVQTAEDVRSIVTYVADLDVAANNAFIATEYGYSRPIINVSATSSYIDVKEIRHPIIELLSTEVEYVKNDVHLDCSGMLLYGINASGKSSLMKAIGINLIMAQAGMFVAATRMDYAPYHHVFTRITSGDNIYRGMSTFVVEMAELRNILMRCDDRSLVLGDELCAGTESVSAIAIVSAGIDALVKKRSSFIFATHLHEINDDRVAIYHMHIETDPQTGKIIYDRRLKPGKGHELYGLEVCASLGMPAEFMDMAHRIRKRVQGVPTEIVADRWSRYNKEVCVDICKVCSERPAEETHHISPQETASEDGFISPGVRVHRRSNLVPLCKECHLREHHGDLNIRGYRHTSNGIELDVATIPSPPSQRSIDTFETVVAELRKKYEYRIDISQWYTRDTRRRCKFESIIKFAYKNYSYKFNEDEQALLSSELATRSYT